MTFVKVEKTRVQLEERNSILRVTIPVKRNWFIFLFLGFWIVGWAVGEITVIGILIAGLAKFANITKTMLIPGVPTGLFLIAWLGGWTVGGLFAIGAWLYQFKGKEIIILDDSYLQHIRDFVIYRRAKEYEKSHIERIRPSVSNGSIFSMSPDRVMEFWGMGGGSISFDYGSRTIRIGTALDEAEVTPLINTLEKQFRNIKR